jgi:excisionase family DNA binding protein
MLARSLTKEEAVEALSSFPAVLSLKQVHQAIGLSANTIRRRVASGELRALRTRGGRGGRLRFLKADVAALLASMAE